jgi:2-dehydro-3-deoxygalactonokinase
MTILGDWGTSRLRLFRTRDGQIVDRLDGPGIGRLAGTPAATLAATLAPWREEALATGVRLCGMAGSRGGLVEAAYVACPAGAADWRGGFAHADADGIAVTVAPGLSARNFADRADVMRGEETQIFGAAALDPAIGRGRAIVLLPGTHSKWATLDDGRVTRFHTFPTGEMFALLRDHSVLARAGGDESGRDRGFDDGLDRAGPGLLAGLFEARAAQFVEGRSHGWAVGMLSGLLIGAEFADALAMIDGDTGPIALVGDPALSALYAKAAARHGLAIRTLDGDACAIAGLSLLDIPEPIA